MKRTQFFIILFSYVFVFAAHAEYSTKRIQDEPTIHSFIKSFEKSFLSFGINAHIKNCDDVFYLQGYKQESGRDSSYGARCEVEIKGKTNTFLMCNDEMIGKFTFVAGGESKEDLYDEDLLYKLYETACRPGG